jgi:hypothetical protein
VKKNRREGVGQRIYIGQPHDAANQLSYLNAVSLKHFNLADVRKLMKIIHERRPDLDMPKSWI